ncbi:MAG: hypothetical protein AB2A00_41900 [Myxococcota bacterium]
MIQQGSADFPVHINALFLALVMVVISLHVALARRLGPRVMAMVLGPLLAWLTFVTMLGQLGFFEDFSSVPPRFLVAVVPPYVVMAVVLLLPRTPVALQRVPAAWLVGFQTFRVGVEMVLWLLYREGRVPTLMTFHGRNLDIIVGLTAPLVVYFCFQGHLLSPRFAVKWNVFGMLVLAHTVGSGILSAPTPFRVLASDPPNNFMGYFPYILLPGFLVPSAFLWHLLSIRQLRAQQEARA